MKEHRYIEGFAERIDQVLIEQGTNKTRIAKQIGFDRKTYASERQINVKLRFGRKIRQKVRNKE